MLIGRKIDCYRPYYVTANNKEYKLEKINFYEDNKILVSVNDGWLQKVRFETTDDVITEDIASLELPIDEIKVRRKENFDGSVFIVSQGKELYGNDLTAALYIPTDMFEIRFVENIIKYKTQIRGIYKGTNDIYIDVYIKSIDGELHKIRAQYDEVYKACDGYNLGFHTENILENLEKLKDLATQYIEEKKRIESLTINDIEV